MLKSDGNADASLLTPVSKTFAISVVQTLRNRGHQAYLVGGCVRDLLLGREPADYDVATDAKPDEVMRIFPETYAVGAQFGVVLVPIPQSERESQNQSASHSARDSHTPREGDGDSGSGQIGR